MIESVTKLLNKMSQQVALLAGGITAGAGASSSRSSPRPLRLLISALCSSSSEWASFCSISEFLSRDTLWLAVVSVGSSSFY